MITVLCVPFLIHLDASLLCQSGLTASGQSVMQTVTDVCFHPTATILASCSKDMTIKFFDYSKVHVKRSAKAFQVCTVLQLLLHLIFIPFLFAGLCPT